MIIKRKKLYLFLLIILTLLLLLVILIWYTLSSNLFYERLVLLLIISISISSDIGGYVFGKFSKEKISKISPNKTYSGMLGSYIFSIILSLYLFNDYFKFYELIISSLFLSSITQAGDFLSRI